MFGVRKKTSKLIYKESNAEIAEQYDRILGYDSSYGSYKLANIAKQASFLGEMSPQETMLELGAGSGEFTLKISNYAQSILASDFNSFMVDKIHKKMGTLKKQNIACSVADASNLPLKDDTFDIVVERNLPLIYKEECLENGTALNTIREMKRVAKKKIILIHQNKTILLRENAGEKDRDHFFRAHELEELFRCAGIHKIAIGYATYSSPFIFRILGEGVCNSLEKFLHGMPITKKFAGSIIIYGVKQNSHHFGEK